MEETITVHVQWSFGEGKTITCNRGDVIQEILNENGFFSLTNSSLISCYKGKIIQTEFTFGHYGMKNGDTIVCLRKRKPDTLKIAKFLDQLSNKEVGKIRQLNTVIEKRNSIVVKEKAKYDDRLLISLEISPQMTKVNKEMYKIQSAMQREKEQTTSGTIIPEKPKEISTSPLPMFHQCFHEIEADSIQNQEDYVPPFESNKKNLNLFMKKE